VPLESIIERKSVKHAETQGWLSIKLDRSARSWPDRQFIGPDQQHFFVEFKRPGQKPRDQQCYRMTQLLALGHDVYVCDTFDDFLMIFDAYL
jgi:hypothetical protein